MGTGYVSLAVVSTHSNGAYHHLLGLASFHIAMLPPGLLVSDLTGWPKKTLLRASDLYSSPPTPSRLSHKEHLPHFGFVVPTRLGIGIFLVAGVEELAAKASSPPSK
jgi:hypothetical protein